MSSHVRIPALLLAAVTLPSHGSAEGPAAVSGRYRALICPVGSGGGTWTILDRDGANRPVKPYLSSLGEGEMGTGVFRSPPFAIASDRIQFTLCGHDAGGGGKNILALTDAATGEVLRKTAAPGNDALQDRSWDVKDLEGRKVRLEARDGIALGAFAWMGVGRIDAGPAFSVDFEKGPSLEGWIASRPPEAETRKEGPVVGPGVPFRDLRRSVVPLTGGARIPCGFKAKKVFLLGCTVEYGAPGDRRGEVEIVYRGGASDRIPLVIGFTLECEDKVLGRSKALRLRPTDDPFLYSLALAPREEVIERIEIRREQGPPGIISIRGITCETDSKAETLKDLPGLAPGAEEESWIESHALSADSPAIREGLEALKARRD